MIRLALKILLHQKSRSILAVVGVAVSIAGFISLLSMSFGFERSVKEYYTRLDGIYLVKKGSVDPLFSVIPAGLETKIAQIKGVKAVTPEVWALASTVNNRNTFGGGMFSFGLIGGVDPVATLKHTGGGVYFQGIKSGKIIEAGDSNTCLLSKKSAALYRKKVGDSLEMDGQNYKVKGLYETGSVFLDNAIIIRLNEAKIRYGREGQVSSYCVSLLPGYKEEDVSKSLLTTFPDAGIRRNSTWMDDYKGILGDVGSFVDAIAFFAIAICIIVVLNTMISNIQDRKRDLGILTAEGWNISDMALLVIFESSILSLCGGIIGLLCSFGIYIVLKQILPFAPFINSTLIFEALLMTLIVGLIGGLLPLFKLRSLRASEILRSL